MTDGAIDREDSPEYLALDKAIRDYLMIGFKTEEEKQSAYVSGWALVINFGEIQQRMAGYYTVEAFPPRQPPHAVKGLLGEGSTFIDHMRLHHSHE